ncbi:mycofactocin-coupled SDR family oxidoreductase [Frankia sp. AiPs1]|uniref:mycofactocin-coupled SDR family oxidoreductase n=1 Tax=Frankia sp. AiPs1 TaxID=573493 RepID=UPI002043500A|nr:mycofactocin-coupled SDR family oxidoreductase [Frankia sp. AiPs1]MCM3920672.1 mycofactocin-coupled SDR family oxidoreductase [Frankia sp. AiPs1]
MGKFDGKVAYITGVARGQGRSHALLLAEQGADIVGLDLCAQLDTVPYPMATEEDLKETGRLIEQLGRTAVLRKGDVRSRADQQIAFDAGVAQLGQVDIAIANAGVIISGSDHPDMQQVWDDALGTMLTGAWHTLQLAAAHMRERRTGNIIVTSSVAGLKAFTDGTAGADAYTAAKTAVVALVKAYAALLGPDNVRVNAVAPTGVNTAMVVENPALFESITSLPHLAAAMQNALPVELIEPRDVSEVIAFLVSDEARMITGSTIAVDAGSMARP